MTHTIVVARREIEERRFVFIAALAFTALTLIVPFFPGIHSGDRRGALVVASMILATAFVEGLSTILGATIVGREMADGRLSFYFAKPIPAVSIWLGKIAAAAILIAGSFTVIILPGLIAGFAYGLPGWTREPIYFVAALMAVAATLFLVAHTIGTMVRSRSPWIAIDFALAVGSGALLWTFIRFLADGQALQLIWMCLRVLGVLIAAAIIAAGAWQLSAGRIDRRRSHLEMSRFLWSAMAAILVVFGAFVAWVVAATPGDIVSNSIGTQSQTGPWAFVSGTARHRYDYRAAFLYNTQDGSHVRVNAVGDYAFSGDGKVAAWSKATLKRLELCYRRLPDGPVMETGINTAGSSVLLSNDGSRAAIVGGMLAVYDLPNDRLLGSARVSSPDDRIEHFFFTSPDAIRMYRRKRTAVGRTSEPVRILEYDIAHKTMRETGSFIAGQAWLYTISADGSRLIVYGGGVPLVVRDASTGAALLTLQPSSGELRTAQFLHDGRIAATEVNQNDARLRLFSADGAPQTEVPIGSFPTASVVTEAAGNRVIVRVAHERPAKSWMYAVVNIDRRVTEHVTRDIALFAFMPLEPDPRATTTPHEVFLTATAKQPAFWDSQSGTVRPLR